MEEMKTEKLRYRWDERGDKVFVFSSSKGKSLSIPVDELEELMERIHATLRTNQHKKGEVKCSTEDM